MLGKVKRKTKEKNCKNSTKTQIAEGVVCTSKTNYRYRPSRGKLVLFDLNWIYFQHETN